jgi:hypothetical protein
MLTNFESAAGTCFNRSSNEVDDFHPQLRRLQQPPTAVRASECAGLFESLVTFVGFEPGVGINIIGRDLQ